MKLPKLPGGAAYLTINNLAKRNALSLATLQDLKSQLLRANTSAHDGRARFLPPFTPSVLDQLERITSGLGQDNVSVNTSSDQRSATPDVDEADIDSQDPAWLLSTTEFVRHRTHLPRVLVLASPGPVLSAGHDLKELSRLSAAEVKQTFALCAQVMQLIRRSPIPVISVLGPDQLATAAGAQLFLSADLALACANARLQLPGQMIGVPCSSPSSIVSRRMGGAATYRMLSLAEAVPADELFGMGKGGAVEVVGEEELENRLVSMVDRIVGSAALPQALGKWAFWTQFGLSGNGDGYEDAVVWTGRVMALHARADDAKEGVSAFLEKRLPVWKT